MPAALEVLEAPPSPLGRAILLAISAFVLLALGWSIVGTIDVIATAQGRIIPTGRIKVVQPAETGIVKAIYVRDGEMVREGQRLIELEITGADAARTQVASDLVAAQLDRARLMALDQRPDDPMAAFEAPGGADPRLVEAQRRLARSRATERQAQLAALDAELARRTAETGSIEAQIAKLEATIPLLRRRADARGSLVERQIVAEMTYLEIKQQLVEQEHELNILRSRRVEAAAAIRAAASQRQKAEAEFDRTVETELAEIEKRIASLSQELVKAEQRVALQTLTAPADGVVQQLAANTVGGVVTPAQPVLIVVPKDSRLEVEAMVLNRDIGFVESGQRAVLKLETFNFTKYGSLEGEVLHVSGDAIEDKGQGLVYAARIALDSQSMAIDGRKVALTPGMAVTAEIKTDTRRLIEYVLTPLIRYRDESLRER